MVCPVMNLWVMFDYPFYYCVIRIQLYILFKLNCKSYMINAWLSEQNIIKSWYASIYFLQLFFVALVFLFLLQLYCWLCLGIHLVLWYCHLIFHFCRFFILDLVFLFISIFSVCFFYFSRNRLTPLSSIFQVLYHQFNLPIILIDSQTHSVFLIHFTDFIFFNFNNRRQNCHRIDLIIQIFS